MNEEHIFAEKVLNVSFLEETATAKANKLDSWAT